MNETPVIVKKGSIKTQVTAGNKYYWCSCGLSKNQPFCDSSHKGTSFKPVEYRAEETKIVGFCGCKYTKNAPLCDGYHKQLLD
jgi:CDGSH iron-sulfur domain-containing protein 3